MMYQIGLIGYGGMGNHHVDRISTLEDIRIGAVYDIDPKKVEKARSKGLLGVDTLEELLAMPDLNAVLIATPNNFHKSLAIAAMRAGKSVISEKPVMMNAAELAEVLEVSRQTGKQFSVHQNRRWDRDYAMVRSLIDQG
ncbi:MAG: Gfo/Idh/MocA family oxidoreductase, partial [Angelakisella sp.]